MSRNLATVKEATSREALKRISARIDALTARVSRLEANKSVQGAYTDTSRPKAGSVPKYTQIFNTDDGFINVSDGTDWRDPTGAVT